MTPPHPGAGEQSKDGARPGRYVGGDRSRSNRHGLHIRNAHGLKSVTVSWTLAADTETQGKTLKTWNGVHPTLGNKPTNGIISTETSEQEEERLKNRMALASPFILGRMLMAMTLPWRVKSLF